jgi:hypothetical protein
VSAVGAMGRYAFDGFSAVVPEGWRAEVGEATYSDPGAPQPTRFAPRHGGRGGGELLVSVPLVDADEQPGADPDELSSLARAWGMCRGMDEPLGSWSRLADGVATASATYRIGDDLVEVWYLSDGAALIEASYVCPWASRDADRPVREALVGSIRFA